MSHIFPRHLGLENVFTSENVDPKQANFAAWGMPPDREHRRRRAKPGKSLKGFASIWSSALRRHQRTNYKALLDFHCPRKQGDLGSTANLLLFASPVGRVVGFVTSVIKRVFPLEVWGSKENQAVIVAGQSRVCRE